MKVLSTQAELEQLQVNISCGSDDLVGKVEEATTELNGFLASTSKRALTVIDVLVQDSIELEKQKKGLEADVNSLLQTKEEMEKMKVGLARQKEQLSKAEAILTKEKELVEEKKKSLDEKEREVDKLQTFWSERMKNYKVAKPK